MAANRRPVPQLSEAFGTSGQIIGAILDPTTGPGAGATGTITLEYSVDFSEDVAAISNCNHSPFRDLEMELTAPPARGNGCPYYRRRG